MPVIFNEPLSFLQRLTEYMEHTYLIHQASASSDSIERMKVAQSVTSWKNHVQMTPIVSNRSISYLHYPFARKCE
ncbi:hypothetical protein F2P81_026326 [Scophthalmus maximus]|uniref:Uncharacterized protein n=1 Tax=Scophthalmus maximus TaxID=52904 RepID=A0A6A4RQ44_SCOMX|nr:hypothetical protein F2P81_026326 [Scophthalmus maximus]